MKTLQLINWKLFDKRAIKEIKDIEIFIKKYSEIKFNFLQDKFSMYDINEIVDCFKGLMLCIDSLKDSIKKHNIEEYKFFEDNGFIDDDSNYYTEKILKLYAKYNKI